MCENGCRKIYNHPDLCFYKFMMINMSISLTITSNQLYDSSTLSLLLPEPFSYTFFFFFKSRASPPPWLLSANNFVYHSENRRYQKIILTSRYPHVCPQSNIYIHIFFSASVTIGHVSMLLLKINFFTCVLCPSLSQFIPGVW